MKPTEEQIKEFWEWCGWHIKEEASYSSFFGSNQVTIYYMSPDGVGEESLPPIDLNSLFKYAVPKFFEECGEVELATVLDRWIEDILRGITSYDYKEVALALFWALYKVMEEK